MGNPGGYSEEPKSLEELEVEVETEEETTEKDDK